MLTPKMLEDTLRYLYRGAIHNQDYTEVAVEGLLGLIDFPALAQVIRHEAVNVHAFTTDCKCPIHLNYRSRDLFNQRAAKIYEQLDEFSNGRVRTERSHELWLLENGNITAVTRVGVNFLHKFFTAEYREERGDPWGAGMWLDLEQMTLDLVDACNRVYSREIPVYEV